MTPEKKAEYNKRYREKNKEKIRLQQKKYYDNSAEKRAIYLKKTKSKKAAYDKVYRERNLEKILIREKEYREKTKEKKEVYDKEYKEKNKEQIRLKRKEYREKNKEKLSLRGKTYRETAKYKEKRAIYLKKTKERWVAYAKTYNEKNKERILKQQKEYRLKNADMIKQRELGKKLKVYSHYGKGIIQCVCCGEKELDFLSLDHIHNDGAEHRKKVSLSNPIAWAIRNDYPPIFQLLCMNCNFSKGKKGNNGKCQHEIKRAAAA